MKKETHFLQRLGLLGGGGIVGENSSEDMLHFIFQNLFSCSQYYTRFKSYCCEAYNILRKSSNLILNLFHLMAGSNIPDIACDPEKGILKVTLLFTCALLRIIANILLRWFLNP